VLAPLSLSDLLTQIDAGLSLGFRSGTSSLGQVGRLSFGSKPWAKTLIFIRKLIGICAQQQKRQRRNPSFQMPHRDAKKECRPITIDLQRRTKACRQTGRHAP